jgi:hypothetical protein
MNEFFSYAGGLIAFLNLMWFACGIWNRKIPASTPASFLMWTVLDVLILASTLSAHKPCWLALGYTVGALAVTIACYARGKWIWSYKETVCAVGGIITAYIWMTWNAEIAIFSGVCAMTITGIPISVDLWHNPIRETWKVWTITVVACVFTLFGSDWSLSGTILAWAGIAYNGGMALIVLLRKPVLQK